MPAFSIAQLPGDGEKIPPLTTAVSPGDHKTTYGDVKQLWFGIKWNDPGQGVSNGLRK